MIRIIPIFFGKITKGNLTLDNRKNFDQYLASLNDCRCEVVVRKERRSRTLNQNSWYHGVIIPILCDYFGYEPEEMCTALRLKFLSILGKLPTAKSTAHLDKAEMAEYLDKVIRFAAEYGVVIPDPKSIDYVPTPTNP